MSEIPVATIAEMRETVKNYQNSLHIIGMVVPRRPGVLLFCRKLELVHYTPRTPKNDEFGFHFYQLDDYIINYIIIIPRKDLPLAKALAEECKLRMALGEPMVFGGNRPPERLNAPDGFTYYLENTPDHVAYENKDNTDLLAQEDLLIALEERRFLGRIP